MCGPNVEEYVPYLYEIHSCSVAVQFQLLRGVDSILDLSDVGSYPLVGNHLTCSPQIVGTMAMRLDKEQNGGHLLTGNNYNEISIK